MNTTPADPVPGIISAVLSLFGGLFTLLGKLNKQYRNTVRAEDEVGPLGSYYRWVRMFPVKAMRWTLISLSFLGLLIIVEGIVESNHYTPIPVLSFLLKNYLILPLLVATLLVCAYVDIPTKVLLKLRRNPKTQFDPGYINTKWQLDDPEEIKAMNYSSNKCSALGIAVMELMKTDENPPGERAPVPEDVSDAERANYIFFGCTIEHWINKLSLSRAKLNPMWKYLAWAAASSERPFMPAKVKQNMAGYFKFLRDIKDRVSGIQGELPESDDISKNVNKGASWLGIQWAGNASRLAAPTYPDKPSISSLFENLENVEPFKGNEPLKRLYLKLSARMKVWPQMDPGPLLYPFYPGIALLLLNADCIRVSDNIKKIYTRTDEGFSSLVATAEDLVCKAAFEHLKIKRNDPAMQTFSNRFFNCAPESVNEWSFFDFVDLWLFTHTRNTCALRTREPEPSPCPLKPDGSTNCFCIRPEVEWRFGDDSLERE